MNPFDRFLTAHSLAEFCNSFVDDDATHTQELLMKLLQKRLPYDFFELICSDAIYKGKWDHLLYELEEKIEAKQEEQVEQPEDANNLRGIKIFEL